MTRLTIIIGRFTVLLLSLFSLFMVMFFSCNLRAILILKEHEGKIKSLEDVLERGKRGATPYIADFSVTRFCD